MIPYFINHTIFFKVKTKTKKTLTGKGGRALFSKIKGQQRTSPEWVPSDIWFYHQTPGVLPELDNPDPSPTCHQGKKETKFPIRNALS